MGTVAWLAPKRLAIAVTATRGGAVGSEANLTDVIFTAIASYLAPARPLN